MTDLSLTIGGYTEKHEATGLYFAQIDTTTGHLSLKPSSIALRHPSYFDVHNQTLIVISEVLETQKPTIQQYSLQNKQSELTTEFSLSGSAPCYVQHHLQHHLVTTAQYGSGHIDVFATDTNHHITQHLQTIDSQSLCSSENQESHAHQSLILNETKTLVTVDLGCDCIGFFPFDATEQKFSIEQHYSIELPDESGPRHMVFDKQERFGLILSEISEQLITLYKPQDKWQVLSSQPALPNTQNGQAAGAIKFSPDERFVYLTGRRQNLIACFEFNKQTGESSYVFSTDCGGDFPRDFAISPCGQWLVIANQNSHNVATYRRDIATGKLEDTGYRQKMPSPVCVKFS
ncbi:MAG: lactonase family protein [Vibrio litoralis]